ncbi:MAG: DUF523 domain-containing protein [Deltaproteobacteria bacterium]|jgi:uncharacterized protein YbbK (DUF523 family)|nr:DUF523 domain-containing protein [Deltaproteobacteria bacterium]MBW2653189.1 DUF523 domain-containing protein [Deltaproteobacteria bacterium]MCK5186606.1 DUF523 domain-containing protein [Deltaproteobacteria bacterium]MCK5256335.1 DUF523 domain-containing protein [Deltaproteobacteria bacterium]MCK5420760.1 DUF523 domain-containing protein [Deltaproteobacteria bacterium]
MILISACLIGINCRFDGSNTINDAIIKEIKDEGFIPVCPEQLGGLSTPRPSASIQNGTGFDVIGSSSKVIDINGRDVTREFLKGAQEALKIAKLLRVQKAILKENSPSCGVNFTSSNFKKIKGPGVFTALLRNEGIKTCLV